MNAIGKVFVGAGILVWLVTGIWGYVLCLSIVAKAAGFWGFMAAFIFFPFTIAAAPLYSGIALGDWFPLALIYGGGVVGLVPIGIGSAFSEKGNAATGHIPE